MNRIVRVPYWRARSASAMTCLISLMPESTAENSMNSARDMAAMILASVVLPVPGGPQKSMEPASSRSIWRRSGWPGPTRCSWPTNSWTVRGRMRSASGLCVTWASGVGWKRFIECLLLEPRPVAKEKAATRAGHPWEWSLGAALPGSFVQDNAGGDSGVERFDATGLRDRERRVHFGDDIAGETGAFVADKQCGGLEQRGFVERGAFVRGGGEQLHLFLAQVRNQFRKLGRHCGQTENRSGRGADSFGVIDTDGALGRDNSARTESFSRAEDGAEVAGILQPGGDDHKSRSGAESVF